LAPARDPAMGGADGCCEGRCVAWERSGGPHRIRADRLRSLLHVVPRAHDDPLRFRRWPKVFDGMPLRRRRCETALPAARPRYTWATGLHVIASRGFLGVACSKRHALRGDGRHGEVGSGAGAATAAWRWCRRPCALPVRERANVCATACARQRARKVATCRCRGWP
jgi:hypothetical protein